ncbi:MAG TPA: hypothetical protein VLL54_10840 [Pyrinomonadaceae bacterium]|nr:hypothetical protein [Pyrinomonadaceae bacterium]
MKTRILASIVLVLGGLYLSVGISSFLQYRRLIQTFAYYGMSIPMSIPEIANARNRLIAGAVEFPLIGVLVLCVGAGLFLGKSWARPAWLGLVIVLTLFHGVRLFQDYQLFIPITFRNHQLEAPIVLLRVAEVVFIGSLAAISWLWLLSRSPHGELT